MSSTNVHSEKKNNMYCAGAQMIPTDREVEIPPQTAKVGPTRYEVKLGDGIEIPAAESELHKNGQLIAKDGTEVAQFDKKAFDIIARRRALKDRDAVLEDSEHRELKDKDGNPILLSDATHDLSNLLVTSKKTATGRDEEEK